MNTSVTTGLAATHVHRGPDLLYIFDGTTENMHCTFDFICANDMQANVSVIYQITSM